MNLSNITPEQQALVSEFFESYQAAFPDSNPLFILPLMFSIDVKTWKFPEIYHAGPLAPHLKFIEQSEILKKIMQSAGERE